MIYTVTRPVHGISVKDSGNEKGNVIDNEAAILATMPVVCILKCSANGEEDNRYASFQPGETCATGVAACLGAPSVAYMRRLEA